MLVMKFGGTSVQHAAALKQVYSIVSRTVQSGQKCVVVLSATSGTTDMLLRLGNAAASSDSASTSELLQQLVDRHRAIADDLGVSQSSVDALLHQVSDYTQALHILQECTPQSLDELVSYGERLSTRLFHAFLDSQHIRTKWLDVRTVMRTDDTFQQAHVDMDALDALSSQHIVPMFNDSDVVVTQGFVGCTEDGRTTTLGRGGSDYTGALLGAALHATEIQIWTDVSGIYSADPRIVPEAAPIDRMAFAEVRELALYGAKVLHPDTIAPAITRNIPVRVVNTFKPEMSGTIITSDTEDATALHAVTMLRPCILISGTRELQNIPNMVLSFSSLERFSYVSHTKTDEDLYELNVALAHQQCEQRNVSLIAVCGPRANSSYALQHLMPALDSTQETVSFKGIVTGTSTTCIHVLVDRDHDIDTLTRIHGVITSLH